MHGDTKWRGVHSNGRAMVKGWDSFKNEQGPGYNYPVATEKSEGLHFTFSNPAGTLYRIEQIQIHGRITQIKRERCIKVEITRAKPGSNV